MNKTYLHEQLELSAIPHHMYEPMINYVLYGVNPGSFLTAVLSNDLKQAVSRADTINRYCLPDYIKFLYNHVPALCWGSPEAVENWTGIQQP